ncbi:MAG TPA: outer membrane lipoprotein carrier protein LolA [Gemmatimonadaceae bacterium]|nr:outer membrane lipoprotein carrier protein LolA [Gemmatimonadaceae bacterium]
MKRIAAWALGIGAAAAAAAQQPTALESVLSKFDGVQGRLVTLSAEFTETTTSPLLKQPLVSRGRVFLTKPDSVRWEYSAPEPMQFVIARDEYVGVFPERKKAERRDVKRWSEQLFRYFGLGQGSGELGKIYEIRLGDPGPSMKGTVQLVLSPKKRRMRRSVDEVLLWVDQEKMLPVRLDYHGKDGNLRSIVFRNAQLNPQLSASLYDLDIPEGFEISRGFTALGASQSSPAR